MPQAFDAQNPPYDRLTYAEAAELRSKLDIGYYAPGETVITRGTPAANLHIVLKGAVEERDGTDVENILRVKDTFDARALVHGTAGADFVAAEETLCYLIPKDLVLDLIRRNSGFAAFFYSELSRKLTSYASGGESSGGMDAVLRARVKDARLHKANFIDGSATLVETGRMMGELNNNTLFVREGERTGIVTGMNLSKAAVLMGLPLDTPISKVANYTIHSVDHEDFIFEALILMTRHNKRRLAVKASGEYVGVLEDIDILGLVAGNSQLIPGRIDRARSVADLELPARDIQDQVEALHRQKVKVEVIAEITSDLNRALLSKVYDLIAPPSIKQVGCLIVMGSEGRGEQTVRTDQDNGLLLERAVPPDDLAAFRRNFNAALESFGFPPCPGNVMVSNPQWSQTIDEFTQQLKGWILTPDKMSAMNLGIFFDAVSVAGKADLVDRAKATVASLMRGELAYLARFAKAIDQFEDASAGMLTTLMATVGVGSDAVHLKKSGTFPIVHGVRVMSIEHDIHEPSTVRRLDRLAEKSVLSEDLVGDMKSALSYFMEVRLRSQLQAMRTGRHEEEAIVRISDLDTRERDLLREALKVVKRFKDIVRAHYKLGML